VNVVTPIADGFVLRSGALFLPLGNSQAAGTMPADPTWRKNPRHAEGVEPPKNHPDYWVWSWMRKAPSPLTFRTKSMPSYGAEPLKRTLTQII